MPSAGLTLSGSWVVSPDLCVDRRLSSVLHGGGCALPRNTEPHLETGVTPQGRRRGKPALRAPGGWKPRVLPSIPQATGQPTAKSYPDQDARGVEGETLLCSLLLGVGVWLAGCVCWSWRGFRIRTNTLSTQNPGIRSDSWNGHPCSLPPLPGRVRSMAFPLSRGPWAPSVCGSCIASRFPVGSERPSARAQ